MSARLQRNEAKYVTRLQIEDWRRQRKLHEKLHDKRADERTASRLADGFALLGR